MIVQIQGIDEVDQSTLRNTKMILIVKFSSTHSQSNLHITE